jgi:hypothetical protein
MLSILWLVSQVATQSTTPAWTLNPGDATTVCNGFNQMYVTNYAPGDIYSDVNYTNTVSVSINTNPSACAEGSVPQSPFLDDALRRMNYFRYGNRRCGT